MALVKTRSRPSVRARHAGYVVAVLVDAVLLYAVNRWPGWQSVVFLTDDTREVLGIVNASLLVGLVANLAYLVHDGPRFRALGDLVVTSVGLLAVVRVWRVFPFDFTDTTLDWALVARVLLVLAFVGSVIGILSQLGPLVRGSAVSAPGPRRPPGRG